MNELTDFEWNILDYLSDGRENVALIKKYLKDDFPSTSQKVVAETVFKLYQLGLLFEDKNKVVDFQSIMNESTDYIDNIYRFGLTDTGARLWQENALVYSGETINWSNAARGSFDFVNQEGYIEGVSKEACIALLEKTDQNETWQIDRNTLVYSQIEGFWAKYYKYMPGGYKINFKLKKR